jgi:hypothetical protein
MIKYPITDEGFYHLTKSGWIRKDRSPFPQDRLETWSYAMECLADDAKERVRLRRTWKCHDLGSQECEAVRAKFGTPVPLTVGRNIFLESDV